MAADKSIYYKSCLVLAREWSSSQFVVFSCENFREYVSQILGEPENANVFGMLFKTLVKEKRIILFGTSTATNKKSKGRLIRTYISKEYSIKQSKNAVKNKNQLGIQF